MEDSGAATTGERPLIDAAQQVRHLKDRGVRFELTDEREAERFLRESNFFFKVEAFAKSFSRYTNPDSEHFGSYINLDFAYLAELTRLDHHLRETVLSLTLDVEHSMKVELSRMIMDAGDDPYELMASFFDSERERKVRVLEKRVNLDSVRSKAPTVMGLSEDLAAQDAETVISALASLLRLASDSLGGIDPDHTERSLAGLGGSSYTESTCRSSWSRHSGARSPTGWAGGSSSAGPTRSSRSRRCSPAFSSRKSRGRPPCRPSSRSPS